VVRTCAFLSQLAAFCRTCDKNLDKKWRKTAKN